MTRRNPYLDDLDEILRRHIERCRRVKRDADNGTYPPDRPHPFDPWKYTP